MEINLGTERGEQDSSLRLEMMSELFSCAM